ncbi:hypothetical protein [Ruegeria arenilitoris]|uniref:hypothetical protein n=1 Tax=Ruegeria arenilitoris TaxID=1173585 RepID=UPI00148079F8|nr:hypothetical protein [Ruegeria arenilitoris]
MKRKKKRKDGTEVEFVLKTFKKMGPIRAEIAVADLDELRRLHKAGKLKSVRMEGPPNKGRKQNQVNLVPWQEIEDFDWDS